LYTDRKEQTGDNYILDQARASACFTSEDVAFSPSGILSGHSQLNQQQNVFKQQENVIDDDELSFT
jgi:hypothetical protein